MSRRAQINMVDEMLDRAHGLEKQIISQMGVRIEVAAELGAFQAVLRSVETKIDSLPALHAAG